LCLFRKSDFILCSSQLAVEVGFRIYGNSEIALAKTRKDFAPHDLSPETEARLIARSFEEPNAEVRDPLRW